MLGIVDGKKRRGRQRMRWLDSITDSVHFSCSVMSDSLQPILQHARPPCPSLSFRVCSDACPLSWWCHPTISSSVTHFSSSPQSFPASGSFSMSQFFESGAQSTGASTSAPVLPMNIQGWFVLGLTGLISLLSKGFSRISGNLPWYSNINLNKTK